MIKGVLPDQPAPTPPAPPTPAPVVAAPVARAPAPVVAQESTAGSGFFGWVKKLFGGGAAPAPVVQPAQVAVEPTGRPARRPRGARRWPPG